MVEARVERGLSEALKIETRDIHRQAEQAPPIREFLSGKLSRERYIQLGGQLYFVYVALEEAARTLSGDPVVGRLALPELERVPALRDDLAHLLGSDWQDKLAPNEATQRYCDRIRDVGATWPGGFVAHHYVRYMGDLSGGQILGKVARRAYGLDAPGTSFYIFEGIPDPDEFKATYRAILDDAPWDADEQGRIVEEARQAYRYNIDVFNTI